MTMKHIVASALAGLDFECRYKLGCRTDALEKMVRSAWKAANKHPTCPSSLKTLVIPPCYLRSATGDNLLLWDSGYTPSLRRSFLLGTADNINVLSSCDNLIIDGTFKVTLHLFTQLLTVHGLTTDGYRLPLAYGMLPGKRQEMYYNLLNELDTNGPFQPLTVLADFETGLRNAISTTWPNAAIRGCYFHSKQCLWRNFDRLGLTSQYQVVRSDIRRSFQNIGALPFLPIEDVLDAWIELKPPFLSTWTTLLAISSIFGLAPPDRGRFSLHQPGITMMHRWLSCPDPAIWLRAGIMGFVVWFTAATQPFGVFWML